MKLPGIFRFGVERQAKTNCRAMPIWFARHLGKLIPHLFRLAQNINQRTSCLDFIKGKLGLHRLASAIFARSSCNVDSLLKVARIDYIESQVAELRGSGVHQPHFWVLCAESMGDIVASEPIARYLKRLAPVSCVHWVVRDVFSEVVVDNPYVDETFLVKTLADGYDKVLLECNRKGNILVNCHMDGSRCSQTKRIVRNPANPQFNVLNYLHVGSLLTTFSLAAGLPPLDDSPEIYFSKTLDLPFLIKDPYIVVHCKSSSMTKDWVSQKWNTLLSVATEFGLRVVEIGIAKCIETGNPLYVDYTGRRNLQKIAWYIKNASAFVGVDSGFAHIANAVKTPSVIILGQSGGIGEKSIYSGCFSRCRLFVKLRPPSGMSVADIEPDEVWNALQGIVPSLKSDDKINIEVAP